MWHCLMFALKVDSFLSLQIGTVTEVLMPLISNLIMPFFCGHSSVKDVFAIFVRMSFFLEIISPHKQLSSVSL